LLLWVQQAGDISRLLHGWRSAAAAGECGQCHVVSLRMKLNTDLFTDNLTVVTVVDLTLEFEDLELYQHFETFYNDILPEFKAAGRVVQLKVCCNYEPHLRGNVYVQYSR